MYARVTKYKMKADHLDAATKLTEELKPQIMALPGMKQFYSVANEDGSGYVIAIVESKETSDANTERVAQIWGQMADHLEAMPVPEGFNVMFAWEN